MLGAANDFGSFWMSLVPKAQHNIVPAPPRAASTPPARHTTTAAPTAPSPRARWTPETTEFELAAHVVSLSPSPCTSRISRTASKRSLTLVTSPTLASGRASTWRPGSSPAPRARLPGRGRASWSGGRSSPCSWCCRYCCWPCCSPSRPSCPWTPKGTMEFCELDGKY